MGAAGAAGGGAGAGGGGAAEQDFLLCLRAAYDLLFPAALAGCFPLLACMKQPIRQA